MFALAAPSISTLRAGANLVGVEREVITALYIGRSSAIQTNSTRVVVFTPPRLIQIQNTDATTTYYTDNSANTGPVSPSPAARLSSSSLMRAACSSSLDRAADLQQQHARSKTVTVYPTGKIASSVAGSNPG